MDPPLSTHTTLQFPQIDGSPCWPLGHGIPYRRGNRGNSYRKSEAVDRPIGSETLGRPLDADSHGTASRPTCDSIDCHDRSAPRLASWRRWHATSWQPAARCTRRPSTKLARSLAAARYEEAIEQFEELLESEPIYAPIGLARAHLAIGGRDDSERVLRAAIESNEPNAALVAEAAKLAFARGDLAATQRRTEQAFAIEPDNLLARWIEAERLRVTGQTEQANALWQWFVDYYNDHDVVDAESMHLIGLAAAQFARYNGLAEQFQFLVNELYPDVLAAEPDYWPAHLETARLFLEKFNQAEADRALKAALAINARAAEVHAAKAELHLQNWDLADAQRALERAGELNPRLAETHRLQADIHLANFDSPQASAALVEAQSLNPVAEETLGRVAAVYLSEDGLPPEDNQGGDSTRFEQLASQVEARNPAAGVFYHTAAVRLEQRRKFLEADYCFQQAIKRAPNLIGPRAGLGMMYMRLGEEDEAEKLLSDSFDRDPFNVRVNNMLKVLEVLDAYETLETEHFLIRFDPEKDELLARYAADYLESVFPTLCDQFAFQPPDKSLFEFFSRARNTNGHGWFSARMIGLPYIGTVGACAGKMVAMASPNDSKQKFNWANVLKHEFIHVINLQQTRYNLPHWFAEAIAVYNEGYPRPPEWDQLLLERVPKGDVFDLNSINLGFIRPKSGIDWQMAYCQAELYAEFLVEQFGDEAFAKLLAAYRENQTTKEALKSCFDVSQDEFERGYRDYLDRVVAEIQVPPATANAGFAEIERAAREHPEDPDRLALLAYAYLSRRAYPEARRAAAQAIVKDERHPLANYVVARLHLLIGETKQAVATLSACLDRDSPDPRVLNLLASLYLKAEDFTQAADLFRLGADAFPGDLAWDKRLARVHLLTRNDAELVPVLEKLARHDGDDLNIRKKLAQLALAGDDHTAAKKWSNQAVHIDVMDPQSHRLLAQALARGSDPDAALPQLEVALQFNPDDGELVREMAVVLDRAGQNEAARARLTKYLADHGDDAAARALLEKLSQ